MPFGQFAGFFIDSCVLLPHSLQSMTQSCSAFLKENGQRCVLCSTVKAESLDLIERSHSLVVSDLRSGLKPFLKKHGIEQLTNRDGMIFARFFRERKRNLRINFPQRTNVSREVLGTIENYVASRLHSLKDGFKMPVDNFLAVMMTELASIKHNLQAPFKSMKTLEIAPDDSIVSLIIIGTLLTKPTRVLNPNDAKHLASAVEHQFRENKWVIFVTNDEKDILCREARIFEACALRCSKPDWALDHYRSITRLKSPIEYFRDLPNFSSKHKKLAETIEKVMGTKILG
ncbi:hypothetical protein KAU92_03215 [Candidatus Bathyarchaeota archaeon]|nr:hypothetical protein [Candidatus Bathyarchaeota archaeon]